MRHGKAKVIHQQPVKQGCVPLELPSLHQKLRAALDLRGRWYCPMMVLFYKRLWTLKTAGWLRRKENKEGKHPSKRQGTGKG